MFVLNLVASRIGMLASWFFTTSKVLIVVKKLISIPVYCCLLIYCDRLLWLWRCLYRCLLVYCDVVVTAALFISLFTGLLWRCCDCGVVYIAVYWFIVTLLWLWRCLYRCLLVYCDVVVTVALFIFISRNWGYFPHKYSLYLN